MRLNHVEKVMTLARCVCRLFLASAVSDMRFVKATLTLLNWFHISLDVVFSRISISSLSLWEAARSLWECRMLSSVNLDHESGRESLTEGEEHSCCLVEDLGQKHFQILSSPTWFWGRQYWSVCWSTALVQIEISQIPLEGLS